MKKCIEESRDGGAVLQKDIFFKYPAQIILAVNMIKWTFSTEEAIIKGEIDLLVKKMEDKISVLVELVKEDLTIA